VTAADRGYVQSDRATWTNFKNKGDQQILVENDKRMFNQYASILVNPAKHPDVKQELGQQFIDWLVSREGQNAIANYRIKGEQMFLRLIPTPKVIGNWPIFTNDWPPVAFPDTSVSAKYDSNN